MKLCLTLPATVSKSVLLQACQQVFNFPAEFGHNWDALWDSLSDYLNAHCNPVVLHIDQRQVAQRDGEAWQTFLAILQEAEQHWPHFSVKLTPVSAAY